MTFRVKLGRNKWLQLTNVYAPPSTHCHEVCKIATEIIPTSDNSLIVGDFNAHSPVWDSDYPLDQRGELLEDWIISEDLQALNSGKPTRVSRIEDHRNFLNG